jgi:hypothetical protein
MRRVSIWLIVGALALTPVLGFALADNAQLFGTADSTSQRIEI